MGQFLEWHNLLKLTKEINNLNRFISIKEIGSIINNIPKQNTQGPNGFTGKLYQKFKEI